jgi:UDP-N-acetylmuramyl tripeptide synthase
VPTAASIRRLRLAAALGDAAAWTSRRLGRGTGSVISGRVIETIAPDALSLVLADRAAVVISGTNGKSTTTALLTAALGTAGDVVSNAKGANMPAGIVGAMVHAAPGVPAVLEVDEGYVPALLRGGTVRVLVLLNLSRDQLDRVAEVRKIAARWRDAISLTRGVTVVANADDPAVVFAAQDSAEVVWVSGGVHWRVDAASCPECGGRIEFAPEDGPDPMAWHCTQCTLARPTVAWSLRDDGRVGGPVEGLSLDLSVPGRHNRANALMALAAVHVLGASLVPAATAMASLDEVEGRYRRVWGPSSDARLYLAKNPAGWIEIIEMLVQHPRQDRDVVIGINANIADGKDTSWLWDVPFERLRGRHVVATGERCHDLAVRLRYAEVATDTEPDLLAALHRARAADMEVCGNYTAFWDIRRELDKRAAR